MNAQTSKQNPPRDLPAKGAAGGAVAKTAGGKTESDQERAVRVSKERSDKFLRLAPKRMTKALKALQGVAALGNRRAYTYTADQYAKMKAALTSELDKLDKAYTGTSTSNGEGFKF